MSVRSFRFLRSVRRCSPRARLPPDAPPNQA